jgi:CelD/BcsL family acetyltransferase involved in cellulose biosynthesis
MPCLCRERAVEFVGKKSMSELVVRRLESLAELRRAAPTWDDLWECSASTLPTARAELIAQWCESFAAKQPFMALVVEDDGQAVAALPLVETRRYGFRAATLPGNHWSPGGDLLLDDRADSARVCECLLRAAGERASGCLWFDGVAAGSPAWRALIGGIEARCLVHVRRRRFDVNLAQITHDWPGYLATRSRNHRHQMRRAVTRARRQGPTELHRYGELASAEVDAMLGRCFEMEVRGWKGSTGGAALRSPRAWEFYQRQAVQLAAWGQLGIHLLTHCERPIAFEYGWHCKGRWATPKVGYDESFGHLSPGQLLRWMSIEEFHREGGIEWLDFLGPSSAATRKWATHQYAIERIVVSLGGPAADSLIGAYRHLGSCWRRIRTGRRRDEPALSGIDRLPALPAAAAHESACPVKAS